MYGINPRKVDAVEIFKERDGTTKEIDNKRCCHCGRYWRIKPGSGDKRGWCGRCGDHFCGLDCITCVPYEKMLEEEAKLIGIFNKIVNGG